MAVEVKQPRGAEEHGLDGVACAAFAQDDPVGDPSGQREVGLLVLPVAQRAEIEQVEGLVPVVVGLPAERIDAADLAPETVEEQGGEQFGALQVAPAGQIAAAGVAAGPGLEASDHGAHVVPLHRLRAG